MLFESAPIVYFGKLFYSIIVSIDFIRWMAFSSKFDFEGRSGMSECFKRARES